jgi:hypothetical protein
VRLVIPLLLTLLRARIAAPLLRAEREKHYREFAKWSDRLTELSAEVRAAEAERDHARAAGAEAFRALHAQAVAERDATKPAPAVPEARRMAILRAVGANVYDTAYGIAAVAVELDAGRALAGLSTASVARLVSDLAREGWLADDGKKPRRYTPTEKGRAALADSARVAS